VLDRIASIADGDAPAVTAIGTNTSNPTASSLPTVTFQTPEQDVAWSQLHVTQLVSGWAIAFGLVGEGYADPGNTYQYAWDGNLYALSDGVDASYAFLAGWIAPSDDGLGNQVRGLYLVPGLLRDSSSSFTAFAVVDGGATVPFIMCEVEGRTYALAVSQLAGMRFAPVLYNFDTQSWVEQATLTIPAESPALQFYSVPAEAGAYWLTVTVTDVWGNDGSDSVQVNVLTPFGG
jgi:hypothetical protein